MPRRWRGSNPAGSQVGYQVSHRRHSALGMLAPLEFERCWRQGRAGFLFLAVVIDAFSRAVVGWSMASHLRTELVLNALNMALQRARIAAGAVHHSDPGSTLVSARRRRAAPNRSRARFLLQVRTRVLKDDLAGVSRIPPLVPPPSSIHPIDRSWWRYPRFVPLSIMG